MCGINGYFLKDINNLKKIDLSSANKKLSHRGPDSSGIFYTKDKRMGLGHTRLSILDISPDGKQPMKSDCERFVIVFNGEIYNFKEINKFLINKSEKFIPKSKSDTEVIINLYSYCLENNKSIKYFLSKLKGIFSMAIWDNYSENILIARDSFGVKPLYYAQDKEGFFFSSELKTFSNFGIKIKDIDPESINYYLSYIWCPGKGTPIKNIQRVLPGEYFIIKKGELNKKEKWYEHPYLKKRKIFEGEIKNIKRTEKLLRKAVHNQLVSDVPIGSFLSGGLDSSSIVAFAREIIPDIKCFTIKTKDSMQDDGFANDFEYACKAANHLKVPLEVVEVDNQCLVDNLENMVYQLDEPIADPASINVLLISKLAKKEGIKVLLSGAGGDDLFSGYRRHKALLNELYWSFLPKKIRSFIKFSTSQLSSKNIGARRLKRAFSGANLEKDQRIINYFRWIEKDDLNSLYSEEFKKELFSLKIKDPLEKYLSNVSEDWPSLDRMLSLDQRFFLGDHNLLYTDKMSMQEGIEVRVPFLDHDLVKFASQIPANFKNNKGEMKWILKKTMEPLLPKEIIYRPKTGFGVPLRRWIKNELKEWVRDILSYEAIKKRGLFDPCSVSKLIDDNEQDKIDAGYTILSMVCIEIWCRKFIT